MASSLITNALTGSPSIYHGFWYSFGSTLPKGPMLTVSIFYFTFISSGVALLTGWALSRIWRILDVLVFRNIFKHTKSSLQESQYAALIVNSSAALDAFVASVQLLARGGRKSTLIKILCASCFVLLMSAAIPVLIAKFPSYSLGLIASTDCGFLPNGNIDYAKYVLPRARWAATALTSEDQNKEASPPTGNAPAGLSISLPAPKQSYVHECPTGAMCNEEFPFTFSSNYTLRPQHFGFNTRLQFTLDVSHTCYRPVQAVSIVNNSGSIVQYGLFYGRNGGENFTDVFVNVSGLAVNYGLDSYSALKDDIFNVSGGWSPNSSLVLGGDTTILFYIVGATQMTEQSFDPIFATGPSVTYPLPNSGEETFYNMKDIVSPIICDTKYQFCADHQYGCSPFGGASGVLRWMNSSFSTNRDLKFAYGFNDLSLFAISSLSPPPVFLTSQGLGAVAASQSLNPQGNVQLHPQNATVERELSRLIHAGLSMQASGAQLAAMGFWDQGSGSDVSPKYGLCQNIAIESSSVVTMLLTPYLILLVVSLLIVIISYAECFGVHRIRYWRKYADPWALYHTGRLHGEVAQHLYGGVREGRAGSQWPRVKSESPGFNIVDGNGTDSRHFGPVLGVPPTPIDEVASS